MMIGFGSGLIILGFIFIGLSYTTTTQERKIWTNVAQRAGNSIASFEESLSSGQYQIAVSYWATSPYSQYKVFDDGNQVLTIWLNGTEKSMEWQSYSRSFTINSFGTYRFELSGASPSSTHSSMRLDYLSTTYDYVHPYQSLILLGMMFLMIGIALVVTGIILRPRRPTSSS